MLQLGLSCVFAEPLGARTDEIASLMTDARWPWQPTLMKIGSIAGGPPTPQVKGKIPIAKLRDSVRAGLDAPTATYVMISCSKQQALDHAWMRVETGRADIYRYQVPFDLIAMTRAEDLPPGKSIAAWLELAHELVRAVRVVHGVIVVSRDDRQLSDALWMSNTAIRRQLGAKVRPAQWGNYYDAAAMTAIGGRDAIERVQPAIIREIGALTYVQLSERVEHALAPATEAKRRALGELIAPSVVTVKG